MAEYSDELFQYAYFSDYYGGVNAKFKFPFSYFFQRGKEETAKYISSFLPDKNSTILDIGCGRAGLLKELYHLGYKNVYGNDIEKPENLPSYIEFFKGSMSAHPIKPGFFDFVSLFHVFEHLPEPNRVIDNMVEMIKPGGMLYIVYPDAQSRQCKTYGENWFHLDPPRHLHLVPSSKLIASIEAKGFKLIQRDTNFLSYHVIGYTQSYLNQRFSKRDRFYEVLKRGHRIKSLRDLLAVTLSLFYTAVTFFFYVYRDRLDIKNNESATVGLVFRKLS